MGFWGPWRHCIGSIHLRTRAVTAIKLAENIVGFGKLTAGLQGSLIPTGIGIEYGQTGTLNTYTWSDRVTQAVNIPYALEYGIAYLPDKKAFVNAKLIDYGTLYLYTIGTSGNTIGSLKYKKVYSPGDITFSKDNNRYWITDKNKNYIHQVGTTTANEIGSFKSPANTPMGITYADDTHHIWVACPPNCYVYEMGTTLHNTIGSFKNSSIPAGGGLAVSPDKNRLWLATGEYITEIGTTNKNLIGSIKAPPGVNLMQLTFSTDRNRLWQDSIGSFWEMGTAQGRAYSGTYVKFSAPFASTPAVIVGKVDNIDNNKGVFAMSPSPGSFWLKAGSYPARAGWIAVGV